jgi:RHH-type transcriptional regulator, proline utilization regulon repressor / proline dehydrogenase / delta 1-pyrroline-5-carboxylate dehydrogenase
MDHLSSIATEWPPFRAPYAEDDALVARRIWDAARFDVAGERRIFDRAADLVRAMREGRGGFSGVEELLREYSLSTKEGLALMVLAEALLRVPDAATADRLIEDKLAHGDFARHEPKSDAFAVNASAWALGIAARVVHPEERLEGVFSQMAKRIGAPAVRLATRQAMRVLGNHFVLGQSIDEALARAANADPRFRFSFDMLGEGARTADDAASYFHAYAEAIERIGVGAGNRALPDRPGISVKLSALHPRYEELSCERVMRELVPRLAELAGKAKQYHLNFTVDAEEADRLELSLDVIGAVAADPSLAGWDGFGLAIQAYQKRAGAVIDWAETLACTLDRRFMVRLVKGAYWDTEIKRAQERGLAGYPVFTRKAMTDLNFIACARKLLALRGRIFPQFATHNALTVGEVIECAGGVEGYEFQRLHGMGEALYHRLLETTPGAVCRVYAPVGGHKNLLAYLVRRLLENGANSSFISEAADPDVPVERVLRRPQAIIGAPEAAAHPRLPRPADLFAPVRANSHGVEFGSRDALEELIAERDRAGNTPLTAQPLIDGKPVGGVTRKAVSPMGATAGQWSVVDGTPETAELAVRAALSGFERWSGRSAAERADVLDRASELLEARRGRMIHLLQIEGGKTIDDAVSELREAVDFCRYYASEARRLMNAPQRMPGPTGESNELVLRGRGVFIAISPWNFPLAIFLGQLTAALAAGNTVVAKPGEQTAVIAYEAVRLLHEAGVPHSALQLVTGDGKIGATLVAHPEIGGVVFTGSTEVAQSINRTLAAKDGPIVPLIAETGGINAMIVDATALPEQVADDVVTSAFRSAGQRCSALRLLCIQDDVADEMLAMIAGAARELKIGDPRDMSVQVGPVIDAEAKERLTSYIATVTKSARVHLAGDAPTGNYVAPHILEIENAGLLREEVFGPILHAVRYREAELEALLDAIDGNGFGLTLGIHSRIEETAERIVARLPVGNVYINRNMIGAVVGVQPFGGRGLSGTGPKAGGPHYLPRFTTEQTVTNNVAAAGGNAALFDLDENS